MMKDYFVKQGIKEAEIEDFIKKMFPMGDYSKTEIHRTPLGIKIIIHTNKPGRIIGKGGKNINEMTEAMKKEFKLENPQLDVKGIRSPNLDPRIVAKQIASAIEKGYNYKKIGNLTIKRIMDAGAIGAQIVISGKLGGGKSMTGKFQEGYLKHCGEPAKVLVDYAFEEALVKLGKIGIKVKIMRHFQDITGEIMDKKAFERSKLPRWEETPEEMEKREISEKEETIKKAREEKVNAEKRGPEKKGKGPTPKRKGIGKPAEVGKAHEKSHKEKAHPEKKAHDKPHKEEKHEAKAHAKKSGHKAEPKPALKKAPEKK